MTNSTDYIEFRGKCKEMSEAAAANDPSLTVVRGFYYCPAWGQQAHWWCKRANGEIVDPTARQFPSKGNGVYEEFDGVCECEYCGNEVREEDAMMNGHHVYCSGRCYMADVL